MKSEAFSAQSMGLLHGGDPAGQVRIGSPESI